MSVRVQPLWKPHSEAALDKNYSHFDQKGPSIPQAQILPAMTTATYGPL